MTVPQIRNVTTVDENQAVGTLLLAFSADPAVRWIYPNSDQYLVNFPLFVKAFAGKAFEHGSAYSIGNYAGAALWLPPGGHPDEEALARLIQRTVSEQKLEDVFAVFEQMGSYHPNEPHWYLPLIGVDPAHQCKRYGATLMKHALVQCDRDQKLAYLESSNPRNITLHERHGFELLGKIQVGASPPICPMLRKPR